MSQEVFYCEHCGKKLVEKESRGYSKGTGKKYASSLVCPDRSLSKPWHTKLIDRGEHGLTLWS